LSGEPSTNGVGPAIAMGPANEGKQTEVDVADYDAPPRAREEVAPVEPETSQDDCNRTNGHCGGNNGREGDSTSNLAPSSTEASSPFAASPENASEAKTESEECTGTETNSNGGKDILRTLGWTHVEERTLIKHMQTIFEPDFDASKVNSLLPTKSEKAIQEKWKDLTSTLLTGLSKRKNKEDLEEPAQPINNDNQKKMITPSSHRKKKLKMDGTGGKWLEADLFRLMDIMEAYTTTTPKWDDIAPNFPGKTPVDCLTQWQSMSIPHQVKGKGSWTPGEDTILRAKFRQFGNKWSKIAEHLPGRSGKQCRERFVNHLDPNLKKCEWSDDEEAILIGMHKHHGNKWTLIAKNLPGRSDNDVKNHWYSTITRKFQIHGEDKLTVAAIQQVFMLVTAGVISRDLVSEWPGAPPGPSQIVPPPPHYQQFWYGHIPPPNGYHPTMHHPHPMPPAMMPLPYPQPSPPQAKMEKNHPPKPLNAKELKKNDVANIVPSIKRKQDKVKI